MVYLIYIQLQHTSTYNTSTKSRITSIYYCSVNPIQNELAYNPLIILLLMNFLICKKHNKVEKAIEKAMANGFICMNKNCQESCKIICSVCKNEHRDHTNKILSLENTSLLLQSLINQPYKQMMKSLGQTLDIMKKLKLIKEFRNKIDILEKQIQKQSLDLINSTQLLLQQYNLSVQSLQTLTPFIFNLKNIDTFKQFSENTADLFRNLDYNLKKGKFQLQSPNIRQKQENRKKSMGAAMKKIGQVRDYSMKIIEVILHNEDTDEEQEDIVYKKKHYQFLKEELFSQKQEQLIEVEAKGMRKSRATTCSSSTNNSRVRKETPHKQAQTQFKIFTQEQLNNQIERIKKMHIGNESDLKLKLNAVVRQKDNLSRQLNKLRQIS